MESDVWDEGVAVFYEAAARGALVEAFVSWQKGDVSMSSRGRVEQFKEASGQGLRGVLDRAPSDGDEGAQRMRISITKPSRIQPGSSEPRRHTFAEVSVVSSGQYRKLDEPVAGALLGSSSASYVSQSWPDDQESIDIWLRDTVRHEVVMRAFRGLWMPAEGDGPTASTNGDRNRISASGEDARTS